MKLDSNCKRILIEGLTSIGIQGVNLRESIEKLINEQDERYILLTFQL